MTYNYESNSPNGTKRKGKGRLLKTPNKIKKEREKKRGIIESDDEDEPLRNVSIGNTVMNS